MMLEAAELRFRYGPHLPWVVDGASLTVAPGEVVGLRGPSGTGKSTLGRLLAGFLQPARGEVTVDGRPATAHTRSREAPAGGTAHRRRKAGPNPVQLVLQHPENAMDPRWTVREVLAEARPDALRLVDRELVATAWLDRYPHEISGGELQRVNLARALLTRPRYLIADEISASLDAITQAHVWHLLLGRARAERIGVLAISHDGPLLAAVADRTLDWAGLARQAA